MKKDCSGLCLRQIANVKRSVPLVCHIQKILGWRLMMKVQNKFRIHLE